LLILPLEVRFANTLRRPLLFWNEKVVEKQLPKVALMANLTSLINFLADILVSKSNFIDSISELTY